MLDTAVVDNGKIHSYLTTCKTGAKKGYLARRDPKKTSFQFLAQEFIGDIDAFHEADTSASLAALPVAIVHKTGNRQELVDFSQFAGFCQAGTSPDVVAIQRFLPPRGINIMEDENILARGVDTVVGKSARLSIRFGLILVNATTLRAA